LIKIGRDKLERLVAVVGTEELTLDVELLAAGLSDAVECEKEGLERAISTVLIPLNSVRSRLRLSPGDFVQRLDELIRIQNPDWHQANKENWASVAPVIGKFITPNAFFGHLSKAFELLGNRPALVGEIKILTVIRPVYDDDATEVKAMMLTNTLVVHYEEGGESRKAHLTLDQLDLRALQEQLDRAAKKTEVFQELSEKFGVPTLLAGAPQG
jgi:hypothetical protein